MTDNQQERAIDEKVSIADCAQIELVLGRYCLKGTTTPITIHPIGLPVYVHDLFISGFREGLLPAEELNLNTQLTGALNEQHLRPETIRSIDSYILTGAVSGSIFSFYNREPGGR